MNDGDLIRRGDAVLAVTAADKECLGANGAREFIRALPADPTFTDPAVQALVEAARCLMSALHTTRGTGRITQSVENTLDRIDAALAALEEGRA